MTCNVTDIIFGSYKDKTEISRNGFLLISVFMVPKRKIRCPHCGFLETIKWGTRSGCTHYYCKNCDSYFTDRRVWISDKNKFIWFARWVRGKQRICDLASESGYSERTLKRYFYRLLPQCPLWQIQRREKVNLLIDGTYFSNKDLSGCISGSQHQDDPPLSHNQE